jgi:Protein of unknown function (DUF2934)
MSDTRFQATEDEIAVCAYFIWEQEGKPVGRVSGGAHIGRSALTTGPLRLVE